MFTLNNPESNELPEQWPAQYIVWQRERGENGTEHLQGYCHFGALKRLAALKKICAQAHWEPRMGTHEQAKTYCTKEETRIAGPWTKGDEPQQGKRSDLDAVAALVQTGATLEQVAETHPTSFIKYFRGIQQLILIRTPKRSQETLAQVYYGPTGTGKSTRANVENPDAYWHPQGPWFDGYTGQATIIFDEFYGGISYQLLLRLLDRFPLDLPVKGGFTRCCATKVVFTSNIPPWDWYPGIRNTSALTRRLTGKVFCITHIGQDPQPVEYTVGVRVSTTHNASRLATFIPNSITPPPDYPGGDAT